MGAAVLSILVTTLSTARSEAHCFARWYYPWPQRCGRAVPIVPRPARSLPVPVERIVDIPIPALEFEACPEGGERMVGIAKLHALYDAPPAGWR
jgi:hypothetical protein